ncbi:MAG TPA: sigma-70 family RNA polymerase sigma factor [Crinalium sp.]|jgi:DNA-directed RNA polymerase specialized sigma24 family protein
MSQFQFVFDAEHPDLESFESFIQQLLELHHLDGTYKPEDIISIACHSSGETPSASNPVITIQMSWLKTRCLEIFQHKHRQKFDHAVEALFNMENPDAQSFWSGVSRHLHQFRLSGTYQVKDIVVEAYAIGINQIGEGTVIKNPLAWLRGTCFNVIRDFRRKQDRLDNPKLDGAGFTPGDEVISDLVIAEDRKALRLAFQQLTEEDRKILCARILKEQSWQAIGEALSYAEGVVINANATRQRGFRALKKLREAYESVRPLVDTVQDELEDSTTCWWDDIKSGDGGCQA